MSEELMIYEAERAIATPHGKNYEVALRGNPVATLKRGVDFGVIPKTKQPTLFKSGAEKVVMGYGLLQHYELQTEVYGTAEAPVFKYICKCSLVKVVNGAEYVFTTGYGSANTGEKRNGFNGVWDADNSAVKMAQKRALVAAAISISGLSDAFTQDMENETFMANANALIDTDKPDSPVSTAQIRRLYAIGGEAGMTAPECKQKLAAMGYTSTKDIKQKDYEAVCAALSAKEGNA
jgi:hypothetical protein